MSTHNIGFCEEMTKIIFQLSSNTHFISSSSEFIFESHQGCAFYRNLRLTKRTIENNLESISCKRVLLTDQK